MVEGVKGLRVGLREGVKGVLEPRAKISSENRSPAREYCEVCMHRVFSLKKHVLTGEHMRSLKRAEDGASSLVVAPRLIGKEMELIMCLVDNLNHEVVARHLGVSTSYIVYLKGSVRQKLHIE